MRLKYEPASLPQHCKVVVLKLILYYGHVAGLYINKCRIAGLLSKVTSLIWRSGFIWHSVTLFGIQGLFDVQGLSFCIQGLFGIRGEGFGGGQRAPPPNVRMREARNLSCLITCPRQGYLTDEKTHPPKTLP